jgi:hypothetical protein
MRAIEQWPKLRVLYNGRQRIVEPQAHCLSTAGRPALRVYEPGHQGTLEPLFTVDKIVQLQVLDEHFTKPGPNYKKNDTAMTVIFAQL